MCYHFVIEQYSAERIAEEFEVRHNLYQLPLAGFYPLAQVPVIRVSDSDEREMVPMEWGLLPHWWKPAGSTAKRQAFQRKCFNARCETVHEKPTFRDSFHQRRCLVPTTGFMEKGNYFRLADSKPFCFAALWDRWQDDAAEVLSCTILTTEANALVHSVGHPRMPVLLADESARRQWLNADTAECDSLGHLIEPYDPGAMEIYSAGD